MRIIERILLAVLLLGGGGPALAGNTSAGEGLDFLLLDAGARPLSMGGAYTALASDSNALLYNPAGLGRVNFHEATFMHNQFVQGLTHDYLSLATKQGWGVNLNYLHFSDIPRTTIAAPAGVGNRFDIGDFALGVGYGKMVSSNLSLGVGGKLVRESIDAIDAKGFALDLGALYGVEAVPGLTLGLSALNIGPSIRYQQVRQKLPVLFRAGAAYAFPFLGNSNIVSVDMMKTRTDQARIGLGVESLYRSLAFRGGFSTSNDAGLGITGGVGWIGKAFSVDYAITPFGDLGISNSLSFSYRWGNPKSAPNVYSLEPSQPANISFAQAEDLIAARSFHKAREKLGSAYAMLAIKDSRRVWYHERLGAILVKEESYDAAQEQFAEAIQIASTLSISDSHLADAYAGMGFCLNHAKKRAYAAKFFNKALELGPSSENRVRITTELEKIKSDQD